MRVYSRTLDIRKFEEDFSSLIGFRKKESVIGDVVARINLAKADIVTFLRNVDEIEDEEVQKYCRCAAIAQMYQVKPKFSGYLYPYIVDQSEWVLLIKFMYTIGERPVFSTAVVSKYGEIIINEGALDMGEYCESYTRGWTVTSVMNGKDGFISDYGELLIPCIFDNSLRKGKPCFLYNSISFELSVYGKQDELPRMFDYNVFEELLHFSEMDDYIICRSKDGVLYYLRADDTREMDDIYLEKARTIPGPHKEVDPAKFHEALRYVKTCMSSFIISREELKQLVGKR